MEKLNKKVRVQFTIIELRVIRNELVGKYHRERHNIRYQKAQIALGEPDSRILPIPQREKHQKFLRHLLKKISKHTGIKWAEL